MFEVRHQGAASCATRPIEYDEQISILKILHTEHDAERCHLVSSVITMQWNFVARIDDKMKFKFTNFSYNVRHPFTLLTKLRWSKNITEEREAPEQIIIGSMEPLLCPILNLAIYIDIRKQNSPFVFGNPEHGARVVRSTLLSVLGSQQFKPIKENKILTHSFRKGSATYASRTGVIKDHVDRRGGWRRKKSTVDIYIDTNLPYPDAIVACSLTGPSGHCIYKLCDSNQLLTNEILATTFAPNCTQVFPIEIASLLATTLIWAATTEYNPSIMPANLRETIISKMNTILGLGPSSVSRILLHETGNGDQMHIFEVSTDSNLSQFFLSTTDAPSIETSTSNILSLHHRIEEVQNSIQGEIQHTCIDIAQKISLLHANVSRIAIQPGVTLSMLNTTIITTVNTTLRRYLGTPKSLYDLRREYKFGVDGNKPAKSFTSSERGQCRYTYSRRKVFWDLIESMVRKGYTCDVAIDKIYLVYGRRSSVNTILLRMRNDRRNGGHPDLRWLSSINSYEYSVLNK